MLCDVQQSGKFANDAPILNKLLIEIEYVINTGNILVREFDILKPKSSATDNNCSIQCTVDHGPTPTMQDCAYGNRDS